MDEEPVQPSDFQIPPPVDWQRFETLCWRLWRELLRDPNTQMNGRRGQAQHGVDVFGQRDGASWVGVQCKGKDNFSASKVTETELEAETRKALTFQPALAEFILATTAPRDSVIQSRARGLSLQSTGDGRFSIAVFSWDDIRNELDSCPETAQWYCPWLTPPPVMERSVPDFLISHAPADAEVADWLASILEKHDLSVDVSLWPPGASENHVRRMCNADRTARRVLAIHTWEYEIMAFANQPRWQERFVTRDDGHSSSFRLIRVSEESVASWGRDEICIELCDAWHSRSASDVVARILSNFGSPSVHNASETTDTDGTGSC